MTSPPGDDNRLFIVQQGGAIRIFDRTSNTLLPTLYLNLSSTISSGGERGLLGLAFAPDFATSGRFFVDYTASGTGALTVAEYTAAGTPASNTANPTGTVLLSTPHTAGNHNGGWIGFKPGTNHLYVASGDSGGGGDPDDVAQDINSRLGKMLRIDVTTPGSYTNPPSNPFVGVAGEDEIWAYGLRNSWRNSFDRANGNLWIADVGQNAFEEINFQASAAAGNKNYGWDIQEGPPPGAPNPAFTDPVHSYPHSTGSRSITGGYVYRGDDIPTFAGQYLFGDYISGRMWSFPATGAFVATATERTAQLARPGGGNFAFDVASFGEDASGELFLVDYSGNLFQIVPEPNSLVILSVAGLGCFAWSRRRKCGCGMN